MPGQSKKTKNSAFFLYLILHLIFFIYSLSGVCGKEAAQYPFLSLPFCLYYGANLLLLFFYAAAWQQIIKKMPLMTAFSQKGTIVLWGMLWGKLFFHEAITTNKILGAFLVIAGILLFALEGDKT